MPPRVVDRDILSAAAAADDLARERAAGARRAGSVLCMPTPHSHAPGDAAREGDPGIYARLASQSDMRARTLIPPRGTRIAGIALCLGILASIVVAAVRVPGL